MTPNNNKSHDTPSVYLSKRLCLQCTVLHTIHVLFTSHNGPVEYAQLNKFTNNKIGTKYYLLTIDVLTNNTNFVFTVFTMHRSSHNTPSVYLSQRPTECARLSKFTNKIDTITGSTSHAWTTRTEDFLKSY